jgi:hypothetical protein
MEPSATKQLPVWHPDVHRGVLDEELYFIFLNSYGDTEEFSKSVTELLEVGFKGRYSFYDVFGNYDIVIRLWSRRPAYNQLITDLRNQCRIFGGSVQQFNVEKILYLWSQSPPSLPPDLLDDINREKIRKVQTGDTNLFSAFRDQGVILDDIGERPEYGQGTKFKSLMMFEFLRETTSILHIVQDELLADLSSQFKEADISLYFGSGLGTLLVKQAATEMAQFLKLGDYIRKKLRLLRVRSSTYIVGHVVVESDNGDVETQLNNEPLSEDAKNLIHRYPDAKSLRIDDLFMAMAINEKGAKSVTSYPTLKEGFNLLMRSFISKNRGQLVQAITAFVEELEKARKDYVPKLCKRAFPGEWELSANNFIKETLKKGKPINELSLGEMLHFVRELNAQHLHEAALNEEWEAALSRFISIRNDAFHKTETIGFARIYEIAVAVEGLAEALKDLREVISTIKEV